MFAINSSPYNFTSLFDTLQSLQQFQNYQMQLQAQETRPKIVKKVETEDAYQIQIFKKSGNFNSYEVKVLRNAYPYHHNKSNLVNLVIESEEDEFRKVFQFNLQDIDVNAIDWEYHKAQNVLVLNVPKKVHYCSDDYPNSFLASLLGVPQPMRCVSCGSFPMKQDYSLGSRQSEAEERAEESESERRKLEREIRRQEDAELAASRKAERERRAAELARIAEEEAKKAELARQEAARKAEEARKKQEHARKVAEERARREALVRQRKQEEERRRQQEERKKREEEYRKNFAQQQEIIKQLFGGNVFPFGNFVVPPEPKLEVEPEKVENNKSEEFQQLDGSKPEIRTQKEATKEDSNLVSNKKEVNDHSEAELSETESINSDAEEEAASASNASTPSSKSSTDDSDASMKKLHKHPSLEEVEDEEFVMFRKKFGQ